MNRFRLNSTARVLFLSLLMVLGGLSVSIRGQDLGADARGMEDEQLREKVRQAEDQLTDAERQLEELERQKARMQQQASRNREEENQLQTRIQRLERSIRAYKRKLEIFNYNLDLDFPRRQRRLEAAQLAIDARLERLDGMVGALAAGSLSRPSEEGTGGAWRAHLCMAALQGLLPSVLEEKKLLLEEGQEIREQLEKLQKDIELDHILIERAQKGLESAGEDHTEVRERLETASAARKQAVEEAERLDGRIRSLNDLVAQLRREQVPRLDETVVDAEPFVEQKGRLVRPVPGAVVHAFGPRKHPNPEFNLTLRNTGIDLQATPGESVRAAASGQVAYVGNLPGFGPSVMLHHGGDYLSFYTPVASAGLSENQQVERGQVIGLVFEKDSGATSLFHFEIRQGEQAVDPAEWLERQPE